MKFGLIAAVAALVGASEGVPIDMLDPIARMGAVGILGAIVVWQTMWGGPAKDRQFAEAISELTAAIHDLRLQCAATRKD